MKFLMFSSTFSAEVVELFSQVFADSEGKEEGQLIGSLVSDLIKTDPKDLIGFLVIDKEQVIGSIFFSRLTFQDNTNAFILSPVAVSTSYQHQGVGQKLIMFGIEKLTALNVDFILTYGDPHFYQKVGFEQISEEHIKAPLKLTYPEGWLGQSLRDSKMESISGTPQCVKALNKQVYW